MTSAAMCASIVLASTSANADYRHEKQYKVTITNITPAVQFTPILVAVHKPTVGFFELGDAPSDEIAALAEGGNTEPLKTVLDGLSDDVFATTQTEGLLQPGESVEIEVTASRRARFISLASMLLPTNDSMMALDTVPLPTWGSRRYYAKGYDAGSETNDELCASIPGPTCGGDGAFQSVDGEGFVHISSGIHGIGDLDEAKYDWNNPVAVVRIQRMR